MKNSIAIVFLLLPLLASSYYMKIGILSHDLSADTTKKIWSMAQNYSTMMSLAPIVVESQWREHDAAADISRSVCRLVKTGVDALVFLGPSLGNSFISSYSTHLGLPFITAEENSVGFGKFQVSMLPDTSRAAADFIVHNGWDRFIFFYDSYNGPDQLQKILSSLASVQFVPQVDGFWKTPDVKTAVRCIKELLDPGINRRIVLATSEEFADKLAIELAAVNNFNLLLLTPVGMVQTPSGTMGGYGRYLYTLTKFSVMDVTDQFLLTLENRLKTLPSFHARGRTRKNVPDSVILNYDSSSTLNTMFNQIARENPSALMSRSNLDCLEFSGEASETASYLRKTFTDHAVTGRIQFNQEGRRINYRLDIMHASPNAIQKIGTWTFGSGLRMLSNIPKNPTYAAQRSDPPIKVLGLLAYPFLSVDANGTLQGYFVDFLDELSKEIKLTFDLQLDPEGIYGYVVDGQWIGIVGKLVRGEIEMAVAPLTKTLERMKVIDFSKPVITNGLNILIKKPETEMDSSIFAPFAFLTVWSVETWMVILVVIAVYSATGYGISRFIGAPDRVRALETKGTDNLSPCGSVWLTVGSFFCRDTGIYPRNFTHRLWALLWWIFCIFISLLYVSMLTSTLVKVRTATTEIHSKKTSRELLKEFINTGLPVIGVVGKGSTMRFFMNSESGIYQQYGQFLKDHPEVMTTNYSEGVKKVRESGGKFAFIMESESSELVANTEPCDTLVTSGHLATYPYGVALRKNSTMKDIIDHGILSLIETGKLRNIYEKWWHSQPSRCEDRNLNILPKIYNTSMTLHEVSGLFYLFILFSLLSVAVAVAEYYIKTQNIVVK